MKVAPSYVPQCQGVTFSQCIPLHAFHVWLIMGEKLKTQDRLEEWEVRALSSASYVCSLCSRQPDTYAHLFFECEFSSKVWNGIKAFANMHNVSSSWKDIIDYRRPLSRRNILVNIIGRLILGSISYFIWQERNFRLFKKGTRSANVIFKLIFATIRVKIMSLRFKETVGVQTLLDRWSIARSDLI